jgi:uncharacterized protein
MSAGSLPSYIEPFKWADRAAKVEATVPLSGFTRLLDGALSHQGDVTVRCEFARDAQGLAWVSGEAKTVVSLTCQRCLEAVQVNLDADFRLALVGEEAEADVLADDEDYLVVGDAPVALHDIVEDELILVLPLAASHEDCQAVSWEQAEPEAEPQPARENPFQVLATLKAQDPDKK